MATPSWFRTFINDIVTVLFHFVLRCFHLDSFMGSPQEQINPSIPSSSSSFDSTPPSSSESCKHDVFLSFRGTDTRNAFVDHLYSTLNQKGIDTYKDDKKLSRGETIGPSLLKAIEESHIAAIVFSENYADSSWCLQELAHIMKCKDERGLIVIPIFYHIDPSELRKQKGKYGKALAKHKSEKKNVEPWRKALLDVGNLSGYDINNWPETMFIKQIVDTISKRLPAAISRGNEDLIGIEARLQDLKSKMEMESDGDIVMVGIWGLGGGGKTTLATALYREISTKFEGSCFIKDVREKSSKPYGLRKLQKEVLSAVLELRAEEVVGDVGSLIESRFCHKKVLMVLDDVDHLDQLRELAGSNAWFAKGSRIIITTRDIHLLNVCKVNLIYNISLLNDDEAIKLFYKHAPRNHRPIEDYEMLSKKVVSYAGGLPLALKVLGCFLCDKDVSEWKSALARLKVIPDGAILEKLKISYDGLTPMEKELFLDIACFFRGKEKDEAMVILDACGFYPIIGIKVLIQKALIIISEKGRFEMHDQIQEMGHYIVRGENPNNPELHNRVWQKEDVLKIGAMMENDRIEALHCWLDVDLPPEVVANMKKLRWFSLINYPATSFSTKFQPLKLCYLQLERSDLKQLWRGYQYLPNLKVINLRDSRNLVKTPDFNGLPCLERMILKGCRSLKDIHRSIGYHERLTLVDMEDCTSLEMFPPIIQMKNLEKLILSACNKLCKFPEIETSMDNLKELCLRETGIEIVPSSVGEYCTNLVYLDLRKCIHLQSIEGNFYLLKHMIELYLEGCRQLKNIPTEGLFDKECRLELLSLQKTSFISLHRGIVNIELLGFSHSLRRLNLERCGLEDGDISVFGEKFSNLEALNLSGNKFSQLDSNLSRLPCLKYLDLSDCTRLVRLPNLPSSIAVFNAEECLLVEDSGDFPTNLKWLWKVSLPYTNTITDDGERVLQSILQGNAVEDYFMSLHFGGTKNSTKGFAHYPFILQLPSNWYNEFSGFLVYVHRVSWERWGIITIKDVMDRENEDDVLEVSNQTYDGCGHDMCYISFGSLAHTSWWKNSTHNTISFFMENFNLKVELVPRRSQGDDSIERPKDATYRSKYWDEQYQNRKTCEIIHDSKSSIQISWCYSPTTDMFDRTR